MLAIKRESLREKITRKTSNLNKILKYMEEHYRDFHVSLTPDPEDLINNPHNLEELINNFKDYARSMSSDSRRAGLEFELVLEKIFKLAEKLEDNIKEYIELLNRSQDQTKTLQSQLDSLIKLYEARFAKLEEDSKRQEERLRIVQDVAKARIDALERDNNQLKTQVRDNLIEFHQERDRLNTQIDELKEELHSRKQPYQFLI